MEWNRTNSVVAKKFEANLIKVRDRRWSSKLRWYLEVNFFLLSLSQLLLREKKNRSEPSNYLFFFGLLYRKFCSALTPKSTTILDNFSMVLILVTDRVLPWKLGFGFWNCRRGEMGDSKLYGKVGRCNILVTFPFHLKKLRFIPRFWLEKLNCGFFHSSKFQCRK